jgi:peptide-methionine (R)-S-oxide reductase
MADQTNHGNLKVVKTDEQWRAELTPEEFRVLRKAGTELPFSGKYTTFFEQGNYHCKACNEVLFTSDSKFDSHCGWPSFDRAVGKGVIVERPDYSHNMIRVEILCGSCHSHLGHVFPDGPTSTGVRYCVNSVCLDFKESNDAG